LSLDDTRDRYTICITISSIV